MIKRLCQLWNRIWFEPIAPYPLAAFRIAFGCYLLGYFLDYVTKIEVAFSNQGVYSPYLIPDIAPPPAIAYLIFGIFILSIAAFIVGLFTRTSTLLVFAGFEYHNYLNFAVRNATYDRITEIALFVLCFTCCGAVWSLDARRRQGTGIPMIPAWQIRLLQFELAAIYFGTGVWKLFNPVWHTPQILRNSVASGWSTPVAFELMRPDWPDWVFSALAWGVIAFELLAGFALFLRRTRAATMVVGTLFHLFNAIVLSIPGFLNCVAFYALFIEFKRGNAPPQAAIATGDEIVDYAQPPGAR